MLLKLLEENFRDPFRDASMPTLRGYGRIFRGNGERDEKARRQDPLERPRAYRALSTKCRTCRCLPSNEDQTPDRAHFPVAVVLHVPEVRYRRDPE